MIPFNHLCKIRNLIFHSPRNVLPSQLLDVKNQLALISAFKSTPSLLFSSSSSSSSPPPPSSSSTTGKSPVARNKEALFMQINVQKILKKITGYDENKVFSKKQVSGYKPPKYLFLSDEELQMTRDRALKEGSKTLLMPPLMEPYEEKDYILADEPEFKNFDICNLLITDLSQGLSDRTRLIAVREPNGVLRRARWEERYRANQIYFPVPGREITVPKMFEPEHLEPILNRFDYLFVLDRACIQFEPDDPRYIEIVQKTYDHIAVNEKFDILRSTRHFGPMAFYLAWDRRIDSLLQDMIKRQLIEDAAHLINLYYLVNSSEKRNQIDLSSVNDHLVTIKNYLKADCKERYKIDAYLKAYEEIKMAKEDTQRLSSHG